MPDWEEKRKYARVELARPLPARFGDSKVFVVDVSVTGARLAHQGELPVGTTAQLAFDWKGDPITYECEVVRCLFERPPKDKNSKAVYNLGVRFIRSHGDSAIHLRMLIGEHVMRALDEQKANARGVPPLAATFQSGMKKRSYIVLRYVGGNWQRAETPDPKQPLDGFTVSSKEDPLQIEMLCTTYQASDYSGRKMIRQMAELSIAAEESVPTRRYSP